MSQDNDGPQASGARAYVGYYEWEGVPCRIRKDEGSPHLLHAEIYLPGIGYTAASFTDIAMQAMPVHEKHYREMLVRISLKKQKAH